MAETLRVAGDAPEAAVLSRALSALRAGGLLIYPTDTQYALGGRAMDAAAARRVREAKGREEAKPLPLVAADARQAEGLVAAWPEAAERLTRRYWPGPLSLVLRARAEVPEVVTAGTSTVAVRVPGLRLTRELCAGAGPLVSTSANRAGAPAPLTCAQAVEALGAAAALALDAGPGRPLGSTILDLTGEAPRLLRAGPVTWEEIEAVLVSGSPC